MTQGDNKPTQVKKIKMEKRGEAKKKKPKQNKNQQMVQKSQGQWRSGIKEYSPLNTRRDGYKMRRGWEPGRVGVGGGGGDR